MSVRAVVPPGVYVTEHDVDAPDPERVQLAAGVNVPVPLLEKLTVPVGLVGEALVSVTVAVHVVPWLIATGEGVQATTVLVLCLAETTVTGTLRVVLLLPPILSVAVKVTIKVVVVVGLKV